MRQANLGGVSVGDRIDERIKVECWQIRIFRLDEHDVRLMVPTPMENTWTYLINSRKTSSDDEMSVSLVEKPSDWWNFHTYGPRTVPVPNLGHSGVKPGNPGLLEPKP